MRLAISLLVLLLTLCDLSAQRGVRFGVRQRGVAVASQPAEAFVATSNLVNWPLMVGVEGGIPARTTYISLSHTVSVAQLNAHIAACPTNNQIFLEAGYYTNLSGLITSKSGVSLIGAGSNTFLAIDNKIHISSHQGTNPGQHKTNYLHSGYTVGSTNLTISTGDTSFLTQGSLIVLSELNDTNYVHPYGYEDDMTAPTGVTGGDYPWSNGAVSGVRNRGQVFRVNAINNSTNIEVWPPVAGVGYEAARLPMIHYNVPLDPGPINNMHWLGFRDMTISNSGNHILEFEQVQNCWVSNVNFWISTGDHAAIYTKTAHRMTIQHSAFYGRHSGASAMAVTYDSGGFLIENNFGDRVNQMLILKGRGGFHAVLYNYSSFTNAGTQMIAEIGSHECHSQFVLFEGNDAMGYRWDGIHGSASHFTLFRSRARVIEPWSTCCWVAIAADSWQYHMSFVGNQLGVRTNHSSGWDYETISPAVAPSQPLWRIGYSGYNDYPTGTNTLTTMLRHGNTDFIGGTTNVVWDPGIAGRAMVDSLFYESKPWYFGALGFPTFGPDKTPDGTIPALYRFINGSVP